MKTMGKLFIYAASFAIVLALGAVSHGAGTYESKAKAKPLERPSVLIQNATEVDVVRELSELMHDRFYMVKKITDGSAVYYDRTFSLFEAIHLDPRYHATPEARVSFEFLDDDEGGIFIIAKMEVILKPESPFSKPIDITHQRDARFIYGMLKKIELRLGK